MRLRIPTKANTPQPLRLAVSGNKTYFLQNKKGTAKSFYFHFSAKKTKRID